MLNQIDRQRPASFMLRFILFISRIIRLYSGKKTTVNIPNHRRNIEKLSGLIKQNKNADYEPFLLAGMNAEWIKPKNVRTDAVIYYLHGGAYTICSIKTHRQMLSKIAASAKMQAVILEYRLAPEHLYPAAIEDAITGYKYLLEKGYDASKIVVAGDSAGGGLSTALVLELRRLNIDMPCAMVLLSPWADLEGIGESNTRNDVPTSILNNNALRYMSGQYAGSNDLKNPLISPIYADFTGFPPLFVTASRSELIFDDSVRLVNAAARDEVDVTFITYPCTIHVWQILNRFLPEAKRSIREIGQFIRQKVA